MNRTRLLLASLTTLFAASMMLAAPSPAEAVVSGANGRVAFVSNRDGDKEIFVMRSDGTGVVQLTTNTAQDFDPAVSGDGMSTDFISDRDGAAELYTMNIDGTNVLRLTTNLATIVESHPSWAPNKSGIAFAGLSGSDSEIYSIKPTGGVLTNLTNDPVAFDANPSWSPGGIKIAFDSTNRAGATGTDVYTMVNDGTGVIRLTTDGKSSNPSWFPDNKNLSFESARDNGTPGPQLFVSTQNKPMGLAVTTSKVLFTEFTSDKVKQILSSGAISTFATLPPNGASIERYLAISPGLGGFPKDYVYATVGPDIYKITPDGTTVTLFVNIPSLANGETGITFDAVGTFQNRMILTDRRGPVWAVDSAGVVTQIGDVGAQIEGPLVAPSSFVPYGGQILMGNEFQDALFALAPCSPAPCMGTVSTVVNIESPEAAVLIPPTVCNMGSSGGAYFIALEDAKQIWKFDASNFTGLNNDILAPAELTTEINQLHSNGTSISVSQFWPVFSTPDLEGSAFAQCGSGAPTRSASPQVAGPHEIYKINTTTLAQTRLTNNSTDDINPAVSPAGATIVFQADRDNAGSGVYEVYKMNSSDGSAQTNISNNLSANDTSPDWQAVSFLVSVSDFVFTPSTAKPKLGGSLLWDFFGPSDHTATDTTGMHLFDSGTKAMGSYYTFRFIAAGSYPYDCTIHPLNMSGTVKVPMSATPKTGGITTVFTITWAVQAPPSGFKYDVQILRPGAADFVDWKTSVAFGTATFTPDGGVGTYSFKARIRQTATGFASDYSTPVSITVS